MNVRLLHLAVTTTLATVTLVGPTAAHAFCGFYVSSSDEELVNPASTVVLMRDGTRTVLAMQNQYDGPAEDFAMVVPVPVVLGEEMVATLEDADFERINTYSQPRLVEYFERDPCYVDYSENRDGILDRLRSSGDEDDYSPEEDEPAVRVEAEFAVGEYDIQILSADESTSLIDYLNTNGYVIPASASETLAAYIANGMYFFVAQVDVERIEVWVDGVATLSPLRFYYDSETFSLPVRLGMVNTPESQDMVVHILSPHGRYEAANYPNVFAPTNLQVDGGIRDQFGSFYSWLLDATWTRNPGALVTEYVWDPTWCDPCLTSALNEQDFANLGADTLPRAVEDWVHTRMRARLTPSITEDIVFQPAQPIHGGRGTPSGDEYPTQQVESHSTNQFQARYYILNPWNDPVECEDPNFSNWTGSPRDDVAPGHPDATGVDLVVGTVLAFTDDWVNLSEEWAEDRWHREDAYREASLDRDSIQRTVRRYRNQFIECAETDEDLGIYRVAFVIQPDGTVADVETEDAGDVAGCVASVLQVMQFPEFAGESIPLRGFPIRVDY